MKKTTYTLNAFSKSYELGLHVSKYDIGRRTYLGFFDTNDGEPFADLSENHPEISDDKIYNTFPDHEAIVIDNDFIACFPSERECKMWLLDNCDFVITTGEIDGRPVIYIKCEKESNWYKEHWNNVLHDYAKTSQEGLVAEYYWRVMCYLEKHDPKELMREDFRLNCERIYNEIPGLATIKSYYDLYNSHELQEILEAWNDLYETSED